MIFSLRDALISFALYAGAARRVITRLSSHGSRRKSHAELLEYLTHFLTLSLFAAHESHRRSESAIN